MRGVAGLLFVFLGLVMGYLVLSGRFPSSSPQANAPATTAAAPATGNTQKQTANRLTSLNSGSGGNSLGLPTMQHLNDVAGSTGGMK